MRKYIIVFLMLIVITLTSCTKKPPSVEVEYIDFIDNIKIQNIYTINEDSYFVFFYKNGCSFCDEVKPYIEEYVEENRVEKIYGITYTDSDNLLIARKAENGHGLNNQFLVNGIKKYDELYIPKVPTLIKIELIDGEKVARYIGAGKNEVISFFEELKPLI